MEQLVDICVVCLSLKGGNTLLMEESMTKVDGDGKLFLCVSPHGVYSYGMSLTIHHVTYPKPCTSLQEPYYAS